MDCQKNTTYFIKMVGKIYFEESKGAHFKVYVKKQDVNQLQQNKW